MTSFLVMLSAIVRNPTLSETKSPEKPPLLLSLVLATALLVLSGCANENRQKIVGSWTMIKADRLAQRVNVTPGSPKNDQDDRSESKPAITASDEADVPMMTLDFRSSGQLVTTTKLGKIDSVKKGRWRMIKFDPPSNMTIECDLDQQSDESRQLEITLIDNQTIRMTPPNMSGQKMKLNFKKQ